MLQFPDSKLNEKERPEIRAEKFIVPGCTQSTLPTCKAFWLINMANKCTRIIKHWSERKYNGLQIAARKISGIQQSAG